MPVFGVTADEPVEVDNSDPANPVLSMPAFTRAVDLYNYILAQQALMEP